MSTRTHSPEQEVSYSEKQAVTNQWNWAIIGAITAALIVLTGLVVVGRVDDPTYAQNIIEAMSPPLQMLGFATITATITVLVLTLTMLTVMNEIERKFGKRFYKLIERMGLMATICLMLSVLLLAILGIPFHDADTEIAQQVSILGYYMLVFVEAIISGLLVALILMLFDAVKSIIRTFRVEEDADE
jgi:hypothetical protein